jgi:WD40-like Beta Propeller Repeat
MKTRIVRIPISRSASNWWRGPFLLIPLALAVLCFALSPRARATGEEDVDVPEDAFRGCDETGPFRPATNLGPVINSAAFEGGPTVDKKETELIFASRRDGRTNDDLFVSHWTDEMGWGEPQPIAELNDPVANDASPRLSRDGLTLYFSSTRASGFGSFDLWVSTRESQHSPWGPAENLGPLLNTSALEGFPTPSTDELTLYFNRDIDLWVSTRASVGDPWGAPVPLAELNTVGPEFSPSISKNDRVLYFASGRPGNIGFIDIWMSTRQDAADPWGAPVNLGPTVNAPGAQTVGPFITAKDCTLYFMSDQAGGFGNMDLYEASRDD